MLPTFSGEYVDGGAKVCYNDWREKAVYANNQVRRI